MYFTIDFSNITDIEMIEASVDAFNCDYNKMTELFKKITSPISKEEQKDFIERISNENSPIMRTYKKVHNIKDETVEVVEVEGLAATHQDSVIIKSLLSESTRQNPGKSEFSELEKWKNSNFCSNLNLDSK